MLILSFESDGKITGRQVFLPQSRVKSRWQTPRESRTSHPAWITPQKAQRAWRSETSQFFLGCECVNWFGTYRAWSVLRVNQARHATQASLFPVEADRPRV